jgi:hypothetical protein
LEEAMERGITRAITALSGGRVVGAGQPAPTSNGIEAQLQKASSDLTAGLMRRALDLVGEGFKKGMTGLGAPPPPQVEEEPEVLEPANPADALPFTLIPLDAQFSDGRKMNYAVKKEDGSPDYLAMALGNPFFVEKLAEGANALMKSTADAVGRIGLAGPRGQQPQVVRRTPSDARDATPPGNFSEGWED